jgi:hypothetical protein
MGKRTVATPRHRPRAARFAAREPDRPWWWKRAVALVLAFALGGVLFGGGGYLVGRPSSEQRQVDQIRQADAARDKQQIAELTKLARTTSDQLLPVLTRMSTALPVDRATAPQPATAAEVADWQRAADAVATSFANPPSGATATNVARGSLTAAVRQLGTAARIYALSLNADAATAQQLRELAGRERSNAVTTWSVGGTQLDQVNIDAGYGHQHVFLPADPGSGAFTSDGAPEGTQPR